MQNNIPVSFVNLDLAPAEAQRMDAVLESILWYKAWVEEIFICPRTVTEFRIRKAILQNLKTTINSHNFSKYENSEIEAILLGSADVRDKVDTVDTIDNSRKCVVLVLGPSWYVQEGPAK